MTKTNVPNVPGLYTRYRVHVRFLTDLEGGTPTNPQLIKTWIAARMKKAGRNISEEELEKMVADTIQLLPKEATETVTEGMVQESLLWNTFARDTEGRPVFEARCIKAFFKEEANILKDLLAEEAKLQNRGQKKTKKEGVDPGTFYNTQYRSKVAEHLFVEGVLYPLTRDGKVIEDVDGRAEKPIHVMTPQGKRNALKRFDFIKAGAELTFTLRTLRDGVVTEHDLLRMLEHGQENGMGAARSQGNGRFEVVSIEELEPTEALPLFSKLKRRAES